MDFLPSLDTLSDWIVHYGSFSLFILLALGIIALPVPEETLMMVTGLLMSQGKLPLVETICAALFGSMTGITTSYLVGRSAGIYMIHKYGKWFGITEERMKKAHEWFDHFGKWSLPIGYFIPGVRHFTGIIAGLTELDFKTFALFAYSGAILWVTFFLSVGYFFGGAAFNLYEQIEFTSDRIIILCVIVVGILALAYGVYRAKFKK